MKHKLESRLSGEIPISSDGADDTTLMEESKDKLKSLLMKVKEERERVGLKFNIHKSKIMANRWGNSGNSDRLFSWAPKSLQMVTAS